MQVIAKRPWGLLPQTPVKSTDVAKLVPTFTEERSEPEIQKTAECLRQRRSLTIAPEEAKKVSRETSASLSRMNGTIDNIPWKEDDS